ncbi:hypothetical protein DNTS_026244 [Danionella cerebrum]|uniref:BTB domain-containing protein n=1 Tax=Danionella cerebrum TaxID=2873325 RepID=A0A553QMY5_9TELE|nr:hypothetical protein DNTS_026244 [Danionella translucida]
MIRINNPHHVPFLHQTEQLRQAGTLCDTLLTVKGLSFKAHALILTLASKRFKRQLTDQRSPGPAYYYTIDSISPHTLKQILDYVYSESVEVPVDDLEELLRGAEYLEVESLVEQCQAQLKNESMKKESTSIQVDEINTDLQISDTKRSIEDQDKCSPLPLISRETTGSPRNQSATPRISWPLLSAPHNMLLNYREIMAFHSLRGYPYPAPMYPLVQHSLQPQITSSLMGYSGMLHPYHPFIHTPPLKDSPFIPMLKTKNKMDQERKPNVQEERETCCKHCGNSALENPWRLSNGLSAKGSGEMSFRCKFCGRGGPDKRSLRPHRRGVDGEKPYQCKQCSKRFSLKHQLDTHHRVHTGEKPFECRLCGQRSRDYSAMIKHLRTHGGATPYQCTLCLEFCSSLASMQKHLKNHPSQDFPEDWSLSNAYLYNCHI